MKKHILYNLYGTFYVARVRSFTEQMPLDDAVQKAVTECIQENILADFLRKNQAEVIAMSIFEYDKVEEEKKLRKAEFDAGVEQGLKQASTDTALRLLKTGKFDTKEIAELCNLPLEDIHWSAHVQPSVLRSHHRKYPLLPRILHMYHLA